jgi:two-component sensor histidine kinase
MSDQPQVKVQDWPIGESEMAGRMRAFDWGATPLGPSAGWPVELRTMVQAALDLPQPAGICWGPEALALYNDGYRNILRGRHPDALGQPLAQAWPELVAEVAPAIAAVLRGEPQRWENVPFKLRDDDGGTRTGWFSASWAPVRLVDGSVGGFQMVATESTLDAEARIRLEQSEARQRYLLALSDAIRPLTDAEAIRLTAAQVLGRHLGANRVAFAEHVPEAQSFKVTPNYADGLPDVSGSYRYADYGADLLAMLQAGETRVQHDIPGDPGLSEAEKAALATYGVAASLNVPLVKQGELVVFIGVNYAQPHQFTPDEIELVRETAERTWDAVERARAEAAVREARDRQQLLLAELQHRVRNILGVIRSVFARTVSQATDLEDAADHFRGRLDSLARTQVGTTRFPGATVDLEDMIRDELLSVGEHGEDRVTIEGEDVALPAAIAEQLGLAVHELTTNAIKYGALKVARAQLLIRWRVDVGHGGERKLHLIWTEQGVPAVNLAPARRGFGSELILEAMPYRLRAETELTFRGGGVRCTITLPLV